MKIRVVSEPSMSLRPGADPAPEEIPTKARRRRFTAEYKLRILDEAERCTKPGERAALLEREGLAPSYLSRWRQQRAAGAWTALTPKTRGRKPRSAHPQIRRLARLELEIELEKTQPHHRDTRRALSAPGSGLEGEVLLIKVETTLA